MTAIEVTPAAANAEIRALHDPVGPPRAETGVFCRSHRRRMTLDVVDH